MKTIKFFRNVALWRFGWHFLFAFLVLVAIVMAVALWILNNLGGEPGAVEVTISMIGRIARISAIIAGFFSLLLMASEGIKSIKQNGEKLENLVEMITRNNRLMTGV